ncbi:MAG: ABC transporter ATP-binding protein [Candidatus Methanoperedens sp.]|nr:ABC transporter ATP-binding protein [Candidatus Methanoperedens sp.]MCZ7404844.1 ABC transporter ATP-binding protein [Candidatus Methanoperedens sp.]
MMAINVNNLSKRFKLYGSSGKRALEYMSMGKISGHNDFWALREISFEVPKGTTVGIIGQNGSGKSTLLSILAGVLEPSGGSYEVNGKVSAILELGSGFHPEFTGRDNVYMYGSIMGLSKDEIDQKFDEILHFSELGDFINQPLRTYSSGMIVRLAFSVAVNVNSDILIVDEALAVGDAIFQHRCFRKIREMQEAGKTILYVGHDTEAVRNLCNYAMLLDGGRIIERGDANTVVNKYHALIAERERTYNEGNLEERGEILKEEYEVVYNFVDNLKTAKKKCQQPDFVREQVLEVMSTPRKVIFAHPPSEIEYDLKVEQGASIAFAIGLLPGAWDKMKQGVRFDIYVKCDGVEKNIFSRVIEPKKNQHEKGWNNFRIGLEDYYGKDVSIKFVTSGTGEDLSHCWATWGWPKVTIYEENDLEQPQDSNDRVNNKSDIKMGVRFGTGEAEVLKVEMLDKNDNPKNIFQSGEESKIRIYIKLNKSIEKDFNVGYIIRNKFTEVYSTNAYWLGYSLGKRDKDEIFIVDFIQNLNLGVGFYQLTVACGISYSYQETAILDWINDNFTFEMISNKRFSGVVDLQSRIEVKKEVINTASKC